MAARESPADSEPGTDPEAEVVLGDIELTRSVTVQLLVVGMLGLVVAFGVFTALYEVGTGETATFTYGPAGVAWWNGALDALVFVALATAIVVPHEWLHGVAIKHYGGEVSYGYGLAHFVLPYAYATTDQEFTRDQFVVVLLTPLVAMTAAGVPAMVVFEWDWLVVPLAANAAGAVGDVWMTLTVLGYPSHVRITDHRTGMAIVGRPGDESPGLSVTGLVWDALVGGSATMVAAFVLVGLTGPFLLSALGVDSLVVGDPDSVTFLLEYVETEDSLSFGVGTGWVFVGGFLGLAYALVRSHLRHRRVARTAESRA